MSFGPCPQVLLSEVDSSSWGRTASSGARMDTSLQESGGRHSLAGLRGKRDGASRGTRACCAGKEGRWGSRHPVPVHFCREFAGLAQTRARQVRAAPGPVHSCREFALLHETRAGRVPGGAPAVHARPQFTGASQARPSCVREARPAGTRVAETHGIPQTRGRRVP